MAVWITNGIFFLFFLSLCVEWEESDHEVERLASIGKYKK